MMADGCHIENLFLFFGYILVPYCSVSAKFGGSKITLRQFMGSKHQIL